MRAEYQNHRLRQGCTGEISIMTDRKPRVLAIVAASPFEYNEPEKPSTKPVIPAAHIARIRACLKYGMTRAQVAEMYGVAVDEVARILRIA